MGRGLSPSETSLWKENVPREGEVGINLGATHCASYALCGHLSNSSNANVLMERMSDVGTELVQSIFGF